MTFLPAIPRALSGLVVALFGTTMIAAAPHALSLSSDSAEAQRERREQYMRQASPTDDFREDLDNTAAIDCRDLEQTTVSRRRGSQHHEEISSRFLPTSETLCTAVGSQPRGALTGKIVFCSGGHGWTQETTTGLWYTQRPLLFDMVEDFGNIDQMNFFADLCFRAGATVVPMRPLGHQILERVVDNCQLNARFQGAWRNSASELYYGELRDPVAYRFAVASLDETAVARYQPYLPKSDFYPVYCWARDGADRVNQTYRIVHAGGATEVLVNHRRVGKGWVYLGEYYFERGSDGYVEIPNRVSDPYEADGKHVVIADAIRFGNGMGDVNRGSGISGAPREEEASRYWVEASLAKNAPPIFEAKDASDQSNNVGTPPRMAAHMNRESEGSFFDRIYLGFHSNAVGGRGAVGLFEDTPALRPDYQVEWAELIARQFNLDFTTADFAKLPVAWFVHPRLTDSHIDFGEIRRDYLNNEMTATIIEVAFHDNALDTMLLRSPQARMAMALSSYKAILNYFERFDPAKPPATLLPEAPVLLSAQAQDTSSVLLRWAAAPANASRATLPTAYRVYHSHDGHGFDGGVRVEETSYLYTGLGADGPHYFRVSALSSGGESAASRTLATARLTSEPASILLVSAFTSLNEDLNLTQTVQANLGAPLRPGGEFVRMIPRLMNCGSQLVEAGQALGDANHSFDSCTVEQLTSAGLPADNYAAILLLYARQSPRDGFFSPPLQTLLRSHLRAGGRLLVSGTQLGKAADEQAQGQSERRFASEVLHFAYKRPNGSAGRLSAIGGTPLSTASVTLTVTPASGFCACQTAELQPLGTSRPLLSYTSEGDCAAALFGQPGGQKGKVVVLGFALEQIASREARRDVVRQILAWFGVQEKKS